MDKKMQKKKCLKSKLQLTKRASEREYRNRMKEEEEAENGVHRAGVRYIHSSSKRSKSVDIERRIYIYIYIFLNRYKTKQILVLNNEARNMFS